MEHKERCQSCGRSLGEGRYGTNADGSSTHEYCNQCYRQGRFAEPELTLQQMVDRSITRMLRESHVAYEDVRQFAERMIPELQRWNKKPLDS